MSVYAFGPFQLDVEQLLLMHEARPVALGPKVVATLLALVERPGELLAKSALVERIWPDGFVEEANLAQNVHVLRKTFRHHGLPDPIETVPHHGYRFTAPVRRLDGAPLVEAARVKRSLSHRVAAAVAGAAFVAVSLAFVASDGFGHHAAAPGTLSDDGARWYQTGRYYWNLRTRDGVEKSLTYFAKVVDADPLDARGYAALADANLTMGDYCYGTHLPQVYFARAREYARRALSLDRRSTEAHAALGFVALAGDDTALAMAELRRAIALNPSYGPAQEWYGIALVRNGRTREGVVHLKIAADLEPLSVATIAWLGKAAFLDRRFGDAIAYSRQALELSPRRTDVLATMGEAYEAQGDIEHAIDTFRRYGAVGAYYRPQAAAMLAHAYALGHRKMEARAQLTYARAHASAVDPRDLAAAAAALGDVRAPARADGHAFHLSTYA